MIEMVENYLKITLAGTALAVVSSIHTLLIIVVILTSVNGVIGFLADRAVGNKYDNKKAMQTIRDMYTAVMILFLTALICRLLEPSTDYALLLRGIAAIFSVIYAKNIARNLKTLQPKNEFVNVLNTIINTKYLKMLRKVKDGDGNDDVAKVVDQGIDAVTDQK